MRVRVSVEGKGRAENIEEKHMQMSEGGKHGGMFKELQQDSSKNQTCHKVPRDAGVRQRSEVMPRFGGGC